MQLFPSLMGPYRASCRVLRIIMAQEKLVGGWCPTETPKFLFHLFLGAWG